MNYTELKNKFNSKAEVLYNQQSAEITEIYNQILLCKGTYQPVLREMAEHFLRAFFLKKYYTPDYYKNYTLETLKEYNHDYYQELLPENYESSYANPTYAVAQFGDKMGQLLSTIYSSFRSLYSLVVENDVYGITRKCDLFLRIFNSMKADKKSFEDIHEIYKTFVNESNIEYRVYKTLAAYDTNNDDFANIVMKADLNNINYLYQYGKYISDNEIKTAEFLNNYPDDKLDILVETLAKAYIRGFELAKKDYKKKETYFVIYNIGQERIIRRLAEKLDAYGLKPLFSRASSTAPNKQYGFDHRFDNALILDKEFAEIAIKENNEVNELCAEYLKKYSGVVAIDTFGEKPFSPKAKKEVLKLTPEQQQLSRQISINASQSRDKIAPRSESSFCIIGFPLPEIGDRFEEIFEDTCAINMIDTLKWEAIQQKIVDTLDKADHVLVKGKNGNRTDISVKMQPLTDPTKQTNFFNCGADVNIPVGEVFTSPQLEETNGVLHVQSAFLNNITFKDLELKFKDGYVDEYICKNQDSDEDNKKLIQENLLFPHQTLPLGEFAIGTNTIAYMMAKKFDILELLPILIVEKMGPHFAIGDTCYSWEEDLSVYNPIDGKEIMSRDNSHSIKRKTNINEAYTNCHTDITLPYEDLDYITAVSKDGEKFDILRDGIFVVPGTEELNEPLKNK